MKVDFEQPLKKIITHLGLSAFSAVTIACATKQPERVVTPSTGPKIEAPIKQPTPIKPNDKENRQKVIADITFPDAQVSIVFPDRNHPENGSSKIIINPQALIYSRSIIFPVSITSEDFRFETSLERTNPRDFTLTLPTAPRFAEVAIRILVGRISEKASRDSFMGETLNYELRDGPILDIDWREWCIRSIGINGLEAAKNPRTNCPAPSSRT